MRINELFKSKATIPALLAGIAGILLVLYAWQLPPFTSTVQTTNNAYIRGQVTLLAPQVSGYVVSVPVKDYKNVAKGELLVQLDDRIYVQQLAQSKALLFQQQAALANFDQNRASKQASLDLANAQQSSARAVLDKAQLDADRSSSLVASGVSSLSTGDQVRVLLQQARSTYAQAEASVSIAQTNLQLTDASKSSLQAAVEGAEAAVQLAEINIGNTRIVAPVDGNLGEVTARVGQYVSVGTQLTSVTPAYKWVVANLKETQLSHIAVGLPATFTIDALGSQMLHGHVTQISPAAGSEFSILKPDNATGNFTKVAQRIPVRIEIDPDQELAARLLPGMSVEVAIDTAAALDPSLVAPVAAGL